VLLHASALAAEASVGPAAPESEPVDLTGDRPAAAPSASTAAVSIDRPAERRCGLAVGLALGGVLGTARGYPNDALKIDREPYLTELGAAGGGTGGAWIGVAVTDWVVLSLGGSAGRMLGGGHVVDSAAFAFHIDAFPTYALGGPWRELGVMVETGLGVSNAAMGAGKVNAIESGGASRLALGLFYEGLRAWQLSMGPFAAADLMWSPSAWRPVAWVGWRTAFYLGP
jgi:hypothetical protein